MQRRYNLAYFILAGVVFLGLMPLMVDVDAHAQIAFVSDRDGNDEIYVMDADGRNPRNLTKNRHEDGSPSWSPNSRRVAFDSKRDGNWEIYVMNANGGNPQHLTKSPLEDYSPAWLRPPFTVPPTGKRFTIWGWLKQVNQ